jgi:hypothetical protein
VGRKDGGRRWIGVLDGWLILESERKRENEREGGTAAETRCLLEGKGE